MTPPGYELAHLSLQRVGHRNTPRVLTNEERVRAYRPYMPVPFANADALQRHAAIEGRALSFGERYALAESIDNSTPTTDVHYRETL